MEPLLNDEKRVRPLPLAAVTLAARPLRAGAAGARPAAPPPTLGRGLAGARLPHAAARLPQPSAPAAPATPRPAPRRAGARAAAAALLGAPLGAGAALLGLARAAAGHLLPAGGGGGVAPGAACLSDARVFPSLLPRGAAGAGGGPPGAPGGRGPAVVWFRSDLRLGDNEALVAANGGGTSLVAVYCFDPREYGQAPGGFDKTGPYRAAFLLSALTELRGALRARGSELVVRVGRPEEVLPQIAAAVGAARAYCQAEATAEERRVEGAVARALDAQGVALKVLWGGTLFQPDDLPFALGATPTSYGEFRARVSGVPPRGGRRGGGGRGAAPVRRPLAAPEALKGLPAGSAVAPGEIPTLTQLGFSAAALKRARAAAAAAGAAPRGGERHALEHMQAFARHLQPGGTPGDAAAAFAAKVSPWLAIGALSPRTLYHSLRRELAAGGHAAAAGRAVVAPPPAGGAKGGQAGGLSWLLFELMWRDFFRFLNHRTAGEAHAKRVACRY
ncbi:MAG: DNA photolyase [Monoraphidium minutum]|nr:MAG: DNA photolyase [Monoraphidium minutum]